MTSRAFFVLGLLLLFCNTVSAGTLLSAGETGQNLTQLQAPGSYTLRLQTSGTNFQSALAIWVTTVFKDGSDVELARYPAKIIAVTSDQELSIEVTMPTMFGTGSIDLLITSLPGGDMALLGAFQWSGEGAPTLPLIPRVEQAFVDLDSKVLLMEFDRNMQFLTSARLVLRAWKTVTNEVKFSAGVLGSVREGSLLQNANLVDTPENEGFVFQDSVVYEYGTWNPDESSATNLFHITLGSGDNPGFFSNLSNDGTMALTLNMPGGVFQEELGTVPNPVLPNFFMKMTGGPVLLVGAEYWSEANYLRLVFNQAVTTATSAGVLGLKFYRSNIFDRSWDLAGPFVDRDADPRNYEVWMSPNPAIDLANSDSATTKLQLALEGGLFWSTGEVVTNSGEITWAAPLDVQLHLPVVPAVSPVLLSVSLDPIFDNLYLRFSTPIGVNGLADGRVMNFAFNFNGAKNKQVLLSSLAADLSQPDSGLLIFDLDPAMAKEFRGVAIGGQNIDFSMQPNYFKSDAGLLTPAVFAVPVRTGFENNWISDALFNQDDKTLSVRFRQNIQLVSNSKAGIFLTKLIRHVDVSDPTQLAEVLPIANSSEKSVLDSDGELVFDLSQSPTKLQDWAAAGRLALHFDSARVQNAGPLPFRSNEMSFPVEIRAGKVPKLISAAYDPERAVLLLEFSEKIDRYLLLRTSLFSWSGGAKESLQNSTNTYVLENEKVRILLHDKDRQRLLPFFSQGAVELELLAGVVESQNNIWNHAGRVTVERKTLSSPTSGGVTGGIQFSFSAEVRGSAVQLKYSPKPTDAGDLEVEYILKSAKDSIVGKTSGVTALVYPVPVGSWTVSTSLKKGAEELASISAIVAVDSSYQVILPRETWLLVSPGSRTLNVDLLGEHSSVFHWNDDLVPDPLFDKYLGRESLDEFLPGRAYWVYLEESDTVLVPFLDASFKTFSVPLRNGGSGWNQVSSPFSYPVTAPGTADTTLQWYRWIPALADFVEVKVLEPGEGYWVQTADRDSFEFDGIPVFSTSISLGRRQGSLFSGPENWKLRLKARAGSFVDEFNVAGIHPDALDGSDVLDRGEAPKIGNFLSLKFLRNGKGLSKDLRSPGASSYGWNFVLSSGGNISSSAELELEGVEALEDAGYEVYVQSGENTQQVRSGQKLQLKSSSAGEQYGLTVVKRGFSPSLKAQSFHLTWLGSSQQLGMNFDLSSTGEAQSLRFFLLDSKGRTLAQTSRSGLQAGKNSLTWKLQDASGGRLRAGVYRILMQSEKGWLSATLPIIP